MNKRALFICFALILSNNAYAQSLKEAVEHAVASSPYILETIQAKKQTEMDLERAKEGYYPTIAVSGQLGSEKYSLEAWSNVGKVKLMGKQVLFDGFAKYNDMLEKMAKLKASNYNAKKEINAYCMQVVEAYLEVIKQRRINAIAKDTLEVHNKIFAQIEKRSDSGIAKVINLDHAKGRIASTRTILMAAQSQLANAQAKYNRLVGMAPAEMTMPLLDTGELPKTVEAAVAIAMEQHPEITSTNSSVTAAKAAYDESGSVYLPKVSLNGSAEVERDLASGLNKKEDYKISLEVSYDLFKGGRSGYKKKAAQGVVKAKEKRNSVLRSVEEAARIAWNSYTTTRAQLEYYEQHANSAERVRDAFIKQFNLGQRTLLDLLDTENEYYRSRTSFLSAQFEELSSRFRLLASMGVLAEKLDVNITHNLK